MARPDWPLIYTAPLFVYYFMNGPADHQIREAGKGVTTGMTRGANVDPYHLLVLSYCPLDAMTDIETCQMVLWLSLLFFHALTHPSFHTLNYSLRCFFGFGIFPRMALPVSDRSSNYLIE